MIARPAPRVWSTAFFTSVVRLLVVGAVTGALTGGWVLVLSSGLTAGGWLVEAVPIGAVAGALAALPVVLLGAATALPLAAHHPRRHGPVLALLLCWPVLLAWWVSWSWFATTSTEPGTRVLHLVLVELLVVAAVWSTARWVVRPLTGPR